MSPADYENELKQRDETIARLEAEILELKKLLAGKAEAKTANNRSERNVRREAEGRTSKPDSGAKRRGVIVTVLHTSQ